MSDETNDWRAAWEGLVGDIAKLNASSTAKQPPTEILILALGDGKVEGGDTSALQKIFTFPARILGTHAHNSMPMPCFDFVAEIWGDVATAKHVRREMKPAPILEEYPDAEFTQGLVVGYPSFKTTMDSKRKPLLGDIWVATGVDWTNPTGGTATECRYPAHENSLIMNERIWEPAIAEFFSKVKEHKAARSGKETTGTLIKGCQSLMVLFEQELSSLTELPAKVNCRTHPEAPECLWWMTRHSAGNWFISPGGGELWPEATAKTPARLLGKTGPTWDYGFTPPLYVRGRPKEMWEVFRAEMGPFVNNYIENYVPLTTTPALMSEEASPEADSVAAIVADMAASQLAAAPPAPMSSLINYTGELKPTFRVTTNGITRALYSSIAGGGARAAGSKHGLGVANDMMLHTSLQPDNKWAGLSDDKILAKNQLLTDAFISFTADWNSRHGPEHQVKWGGTFNRGASAIGEPAKGLGITEFHHWELTGNAVYLALAAYDIQLEAIGAPIAANFKTIADGGRAEFGGEEYKTVESLLNALYKKLNDGTNNLKAEYQFTNELRKKFATVEDAIAQGAPTAKTAGG